MKHRGYIMNIGILGSGDVGQSLGTGFTALGHDVMMGSRTPESEKIRDWKKRAGSRALSGTFEETAAFAHVAVLASLWSGTKNLLKLAGPQNLEDKVVIDVTNPLLFDENKPPRLALGHTDSGGEQIQRWLPKSHVVKAFNIVGHSHMINPDFPDGPPDMFICGNDPVAKETVDEICREFGWSVIDIGGIEGSRLLEPMCILWVQYGINSGTWNHAFKLLRK